MKRMHRTRGFTLVELLVVIGIIALLISILLPSLNRARETANKVKCAANLKSIGQSILLYANDNKQAFPRTIGGGGAAAFSVTPSWGTIATSSNPFQGVPGIGCPKNDVSSCLYLLLTTQDLTGAIFVCPSSNATAWDFGGGSNVATCWCNWNGNQASNPSDGATAHVSYSLQMAWTDDGGVGNGFKFNASLGADYALMSDINPGTPVQKDGVGLSAGGANDNVCAVTQQSNATQMKQGNSNNHDKDGQNILYCDGHVDFQASPFAGPGSDNIFARRADSTGTISDWNHPFAGSYDSKDNLLLPTD